MPSAASIRQPNATTVYASVITNFRRAYLESDYPLIADLSDEEVLLCWEYGWQAGDGEEEDAWTLEHMRDTMIAKKHGWATSHA